MAAITGMHAVEVTEVGKLIADTTSVIPMLEIIKRECSQDPNTQIRVYTNRDLYGLAVSKKDTTGIYEDEEAVCKDETPQVLFGKIMLGTFSSHDNKNTFISDEQKEVIVLKKTTICDTVFTILYVLVENVA